MPVPGQYTRRQASEQRSARADRERAYDKCSLNRLHQGKQKIACYRKHSTGHHGVAQADAGNHARDDQTQPAHRQHREGKDHRGHAPRRVETGLNRQYADRKAAKRAPCGCVLREKCPDEHHARCPPVRVSGGAPLRKAAHIMAIPKKWRRRA